MKNNMALIIGALLLSLCGASQAMADTLLDLVDAPVQSFTPYDLTFTATDVDSDISFAGYQLPAFEYAEDIELIDTTAGSANLFGPTWNFTQAACGSDASQFGDGYGSGTNGVVFGGVCLGSFDTYDQDVTTVVGDQYSLSFLFSQTNPNDSEFTVSATNDSTGAPEPASMFLFGSGLVGATIAARKRRNKVHQDAMRSGTTM